MIKKIIRIDYGKSTLDECAVYEGGSRTDTIPILFSVFLIITEDKNILVDAGCETMPGFEMEDFVGTVAALKEKGYTPEDITDVIITHADHDHIECVKYFQNATIYIQKDEYESGASYIPEVMSVRTFAEEYEIEKGIKILKVGGHQKGSCIVECEIDDKIHVFCGDECYSYYNLIHKIPTASCYSKENSTYFIHHYSSDKYICYLCHERGSYETDILE